MIEDIAAMNDLPELARVRQARALDAEEGGSDARDALELVEARIAQVRLEQERRDLAAVERARRTAERAREDASRRLAAFEAAFAELDACLTAPSDGDDVPATRDLVERSKAFLRLLAEQPPEIAHRRRQERLANVVATRLASLPHVRVPKRWVSPQQLAERLEVEA